MIQYCQCSVEMYALYGCVISLCFHHFLLHQIFIPSLFLFFGAIDQSDGAPAYFLSKIILEIPLVLLQVLVQFVICYFLLDMQGNFGIIVASVFGLSMAATSIAIALGCSVKDVKDATEMAPLLFVPQMLFVGFFIRTSQIPIFLRWAQYLCSLKYSMNIVLITEFDLRLDSCKGDIAEANCRSVLENNDIVVGDWWIHMLLLFALFVGGRLLGAYILIQKAKRFY